MSNLSKILAFLLLNISSVSYTAEPKKPQVYLFHLQTESVLHPKTGKQMPYERTELHQCETKIASSESTFKGYNCGTVTPILPSARVVIVKGLDGEIVEAASTTTPYPDPAIGEFLDAFHTKASKQTQDITRLILHFMKIRSLEKPESEEDACEEESLAKIAIMQILTSEIPKEVQTIINWEKQAEVAQRKYKVLARLAKIDPKYEMEAFLENKKAQGFDADLAILYKGCGSVQCKSARESQQAALYGKKLVAHINKPLEASIQAAKAAEKAERLSRRELK